MAAKKKSLWKKSREATKKLLPEAKAKAARRQKGADEAAEYIEGRKVYKKPAKKKAAKRAIMKGKIDRTPIKKKKR